MGGTGSHCRILIKIGETPDPVCKPPRGQTPRNLLFQRQELRFREVKTPVRCHAAGQTWQERNRSLPEHLLLLPCATEAADLCLELLSLQSTSQITQHFPSMLISFPSTTLYYRQGYHSHFTVEETEIQGGYRI